MRHIKAEIELFRRLNLTVSMWLEAFSIIIELSHKILWEEFRIKTNRKGRPRIAAFNIIALKTMGEHMFWWVFNTWNHCAAAHRRQSASAALR